MEANTVPSNRCLNDIFYYCDTTPDYNDIPAKKTVYDYQGMAHLQADFTQYCKLSPDTCGHMLSLETSLIVNNTPPH